MKYPSTRKQIQKRAARIRVALDRETPILEARGGLREDRWQEALNALTPAEREEATIRLKHKNDPPWRHLERDIKRYWPKQRRRLSQKWMNLCAHDRAKLQAHIAPEIVTALDDEGEAAQARAKRKEQERLERENEPQWKKLERRIEAAWPKGQEEVIKDWRTLSNEDRTTLRERLDANIAAALDEGVKEARAIEQRERKERRARKEEEDRKLADAAKAVIGTGSGQIHRAACSDFNVRALRLGGLSEKAILEARELRSSAMTLGPAAARIGIPKGRLDRWQREGLVEYSFTRRMHINGVGRFEGRLWTTQDADRIKDRLEEIEETDGKARAAKRKAAVRRAKARPDTPRVKRRIRQKVDHERPRSTTRSGRILDEVLDDWKVRIGFTDTILADAEKASTNANTKKDTTRQDLRHIPFITIDPEDAMDHDDAVWCQRINDGWELHVAIADVAALVRAGSRLDRAITPRGQSIYLPGRCIPMCPPVLSEGACSLVAGEVRLALWTMLHIDHDGHSTSDPKKTMCPALVQVKKQMSYGEAQHRIDDPDTHDDQLEALRECTRAREQRRQRNGAIVLERNEDVRININTDGNVEWPVCPVRTESEKIIEEAMIAHNVMAGEWLRDIVNAPGAIYRSHEEPGYEDLGTGMNAARTAGVKFHNGVTPRATLHAMLEAGRRIDKQRWAELGTRIAMPKAYYSHDAEPHFGLAEAVYAHTTSPIRRYADLVNQRCAHAWHNSSPEDQPKQNKRLCNDLNQDEIYATKIERVATQRLIALSMDTRTPKEWMSGYIVGVQPFGLFVEAEQIPGAQAMCHVSEIDGDWYDLASNGELAGEHTGRSWRLGQRVEINFGMIDLGSGKLDAWVRRPGEKRKFVERRRRRKDWD